MIGRMEAIKTRQCTIKNTPVPESAKCFDKPIPWYTLEALKPMGRMDGDMAINSTGYEVAVEWRQKCDRLQQENWRLLAENRQINEQWKKSVDTCVEQNQEIERLKATRMPEDTEWLHRECERLRQALAVSDRDGKFMAQKLEEAMCQIRFIESCDSDEVRRLKAELEQIRLHDGPMPREAADHGLVDNLKAENQELDARRATVERDYHAACEVIKHLVKLL